MTRMSFIVCLLLFFASPLSAQDTADHGFIHPGGLHTQEDFDRVKAQIAVYKENHLSENLLAPIRDDRFYSGSRNLSHSTPLLLIRID